MKTSTWCLALCLVVLVTVESGCSFFMSTVPDDYRPQDPPDCTDSSLLPIIDTLQSISGLVLGAIYLAMASQASDDSMLGVSSLEINGYSGLISGAIYGGAAILGYSRASRCQEAKTKHEDWNRQKILRLEAEIEAAKEAPGSAAVDGSP